MPVVQVTAPRYAEIMSLCEVNHDGKLVPFAELFVGYSALRPDRKPSHLSAIAELALDSHAFEIIALGFGNN
jgi:hypothetical protein